MDWEWGMKNTIVGYGEVPHKAVELIEGRYEFRCTERGEYIISYYTKAGRFELCGRGAATLDWLNGKLLVTGVDNALRPAYLSSSTVDATDVIRVTVVATYGTTFAVAHCPKKKKEV